MLAIGLPCALYPQQPFANACLCRRSHGGVSGLDVWPNGGRPPSRRSAKPVLRVPGESNYLLNPAHPKFARIAIGAPERFELDLRLL